ncbi:O-antigen ligase family protein [Mycolicibacterium sediminis]|uniref:O-antigen ligase-related domain-containing protein n=1 Tax=Mycolicibacterium sediminis TaxID=1286180 RepID=A0A7I7QS18_9MYCO|nr:O-antigen ligase family protein [Mycolicibacterium sediminis]BBY28616.1 hypothetical protein MSEDJ_27120 [Mycolicibacterium sediminis]
MTSEPLTTLRPLPGDVVGAVRLPAWVPKAAIASFLVASFTATWGGFMIAGLQLADMFLVMSLGVIGVLVVFGDLRFRIPWWLFAPVVALLACLLALSVVPIPDAVFGARYQPPFITPDSLVKALYWIIALVAVPLAAVACSALDARVVTWILACFLAGVCVSAMVALTDLTALTHIAQSIGYDSNNRRQPGLTVHPNSLGITCVIAAPFAVHFMNQARHHWLPTIALVILFGGALATGSRGTQAVLPLAVLAAILVSPHKKRVLGLLAGIAVAGILGGFFILQQLVLGFLGELLRFGGTNVNTGGDTERRMVTLQALEDISRYPFFGIGIEHIVEAHNIYLQILSAGGLVLAAGMFTYWFCALFSCWRAGRHGVAVAPFLVISIVAWLAIGAIENQLTDRLLYYTVGCAAALAAAHVSERVKRPRIRASRTGPTR